MAVGASGGAKYLLGSILLLIISLLIIKFANEIFRIISAVAQTIIRALIFKQVPTIISHIYNKLKKMCFFVQKKFLSFGINQKFSDKIKKNEKNFFKKNLKKKNHLCIKI